MSYILEALRMSEEERQRGEVPDVFAPAGTASGARAGSPRWPYLLSAVLVLNLAVLVAWLRPWEPHGPMEQRPPPSATDPARAPGSPIPDTASAEDSQAADADPAPYALSAKHPGSGSPRPAAQAAKPRTSARTAHPAGTAAAGAEAARGADAGLGRMPTEQLEKTTPPARKDEPMVASLRESLAAAKPLLKPGATPEDTAGNATVPGTSPGSSLSVAPAAPGAGEPAEEALSGSLEKREVTPPAPEGVRTRLPSRRSVAAVAPPAPPDFAPEASEGNPTVADPPPAAQVEKPRPAGIRALPDPIKAALPDIAFSFHLYARKPHERRLRVNGKTVGEGDRITNELHVAEITRDGAILEIRGHRFLMGVREVWRAR